MNLLLLGLLHPYRAFCNARHENFILVLISFLLGVGFLFFGVQEFFKYIDFQFPSQIISHINQFPYIETISIPDMNVLTLFIRSLVILSLFSVGLTLLNWMWGNVFSSYQSLSLSEHFKSSLIFFYSFSFYLIIIDIVLYMTDAQNLYFIFLGLDVLILMTFLYSAIYLTTLPKALFNILTTLFTIALIVGTLYTVSLFITDESVEQDLKNNFDKAIDSIDN